MRRHAHENAVRACDRAHVARLARLSASDGADVGGLDWRMRESKSRRARDRDVHRTDDSACVRAAWRNDDDDDHDDRIVIGGLHDMARFTWKRYERALQTLGAMRGTQ